VSPIENQAKETPDAAQEAYTLQSALSELNALKRKYSRLQKDNDNVTHLYKQAAALRDFNEKEKETQMRYNQMLRDNSPDDIFLLDMESECPVVHVVDKKKNRPRYKGRTVSRCHSGDVRRWFCP